MSDSQSEARRLEALWRGEFGDAYVERNLHAHKGRQAFWEMVLSQFPVRNALEIGCNVGANLRCIVEFVPAHGVFGIDINEKALTELRQKLPGTKALYGTSRQLPFRDGCFDLVFTTGLLIHQPPEVLPLVMSEIVRCSRRYILCGEYFAEEPTQVPYRGETGALFKRDFGKLYRQLFPELRLIKTGFLPRQRGGWDDVTYWMFEKASLGGMVGGSA